MEQATRDDVAFWALLILGNLFIKWGDFWSAAACMLFALFILIRSWKRWTTKK